MLQNNSQSVHSPNKLLCRVLNLGNKWLIATEKTKKKEEEKDIPSICERSLPFPYRHSCLLTNQTAPEP